MFRNRTGVEQALSPVLNRTNMVNAQAEAWRPPLFAAPSGVVSRIAAALRRFFDIQAGSVWNDVSAVLPTVRGTIVDVGCGLAATDGRFASVRITSDGE